MIRLAIAAAALAALVLMAPFAIDFLILASLAYGWW